MPLLPAVGDGGEVWAGVSIFTVIEQAKRREDVVAAYADEIREWHTYPWALQGPWWRDVNQAIIDKWSVAGLQYIKDRAWKLTA